MCYAVQKRKEKKTETLGLALGNRGVDQSEFFAIMYTVKLCKAGGGKKPCKILRRVLPETVFLEWGSNLPEPYFNLITKHILPRLN